MKTVSNQQSTSLWSAAARGCAGLAQAISRTRAVWLVLAVLGLLWPGVAQAQYTYTELIVNGQSTSAQGIDGSRVVGAVGTNGFIYDGTNSVVLANPAGSTSAFLRGISGNKVLGRYEATVGGTRSYIYDFVSSTFTLLTPPITGVITDIAQGISGNRVVGYYYGSSGVVTGYLFDGTNYSSLQAPLGANGTTPSGISGNSIVGHYTDASWNNHGFHYNSATQVYTTVDNPLGTDGTLPSSVSGNFVAGYYTDSRWNNHGFIYNISSGTFTKVDHGPSDSDNRINGISDGVLVGIYGVQYITHGFVAIPAMPLPTATTLAATNILSTGATLNASINPGGYADAFFQYGTSTNSGLSLVLAQAGLTGSSVVSANLPLTGLLPGATYYYRSVATNTAGTNNGVYLSFTTISTNASLSGLALSGGTLAPTFAASTVSYTASVPNTTTNITVTPTAAQANATITVNGTTVTSGSASEPVSLVVGPNTVTVVVTAQDQTSVNWRNLNSPSLVELSAAPPSG